MPKNPRIVSYQDQALKSLAKRHKAFETAYKSWALPLMKFLIFRMGGDRQAAEEVFAQTIFSAWRGWHTFENKASFFTWVCKIGLHKVADYYKDQINNHSKLIYPTLNKFSSFESSDLSAEEKLVIKDLQIALSDCLNLLPVKKRRLLQLKYWHHLTNKKIAGILGVSERAVEGQLYRSRLELKNIITSNHPDIALAYQKTK